MGSKHNHNDIDHIPIDCQCKKKCIPAPYTQWTDYGLLGVMIEFASWHTSIYGGGVCIMFERTLIFLQL